MQIIGGIGVHQHDALVLIHGDLRPDLRQIRLQEVYIEVWILVHLLQQVQVALENSVYPEHVHFVLKNLQKTAEERAAQSEKFKVDFKISEHFPYMFEEPYVHYHDSLGVELDTLTREYRMKPVELSDTTYSGPEMIVRTDTLAVTDSVIESSGLATKDSLIVKGKPKDALKDALKQKTDPKEIRHLPVKNLKKDKENILVPMKMPLEKK